MLVQGGLDQQISDEVLDGAKFLNQEHRVFLILLKTCLLFGGCFYGCNPARLRKNLHSMNRRYFLIECSDSRSDHSRYHDSRPDFEAFPFWYMYMYDSLYP